MSKLSAYMRWLSVSLVVVSLLFGAFGVWNVLAVGPDEGSEPTLAQNQDQVEPVTTQTTVARETGSTDKVEELTKTPEAGVSKTSAADSHPEKVDTSATLPTKNEAETKSPVMQPSDQVRPQNDAETSSNVMISGGKKIFSQLQLHQVYLLDEKVSIKFTKFDETVSAPQLTFEKKEVRVNGQLVPGFEITSNMTNGRFRYDLTLPNPTGSTQARVKYSENGVDFQEIVEKTVGLQEVKLKNLDHFTIFVVVNTPEPQPVLGSGLFINEVYFMGTNNTDNKEWVELYNSTDADINLQNYVLQLQDGLGQRIVISAPLVIPAKGFVLISRGDFNWSNNYLNNLTPLSPETEDFIRLFNPHDQLLDSWKYSKLHEAGAFDLGNFQIGDTIARKTDGSPEIVKRSGLLEVTPGTSNNFPSNIINMPIGHESNLTYGATSRDGVLVCGANDIVYTNQNVGGRSRQVLEWVPVSGAVLYRWNSFRWNGSNWVRVGLADRTVSATPMFVIAGYDPARLNSTAASDEIYTELDTTHNVFRYITWGTNQGIYTRTVEALDGDGRVIGTTQVAPRNLLPEGSLHTNLNVCSRFVIDRTAPTGSITSPTSGAVVSGSLAISGVAGDALSGVKTVQVRFRNTDSGAETDWIDASWHTDGTFTVNYDTTTLVNGNYQIALRVTDNAGNVFTQTVATTVVVENLRYHIEGQKVIDFNRNGVIDDDEEDQSRDPTEPLGQGWQIYLFDANWSLVRSMETGEVTNPGNIANARNQYRFVELLNGTYFVCEEQRDGWLQVPLVPDQAEDLVTTDNDARAEYGLTGQCIRVVINQNNRSEIHFLNQPPVQLTVCKQEQKADGTLAAVAGWAMHLNDLTQNTEVDGCTVFQDLTVGTYVLSEEIQSDWKFIGVYRGETELDQFDDSGSGLIDLDDDTTITFVNKFVPLPTLEMRNITIHEVVQPLPNVADFIVSSSGGDIVCQYIPAEPLNNRATGGNAQYVLYCTVTNELGKGVAREATLTVLDNVPVITQISNLATTLRVEFVGGNPGYTYAWSGSCFGTTQTVSKPATPGNYTCNVTVTDVDGDVAFASISFRVSPAINLVPRNDTPSGNPNVGAITDFEAVSQNGSEQAQGQPEETETESEPLDETDSPRSRVLGVAESQADLTTNCTQTGFSWWLIWLMLATLLGSAGYVFVDKTGKNRKDVA